jgi:hypothetical protein
MTDYKLSDTNIIRIQKNEFPKNSEKYYLDIRKFYWDDGPKPGWQPTRKGISIPWNIAENILNMAKKIFESDGEVSEEKETE